MSAEPESASTIPGKQSSGKANVTASHKGQCHYHQPIHTTSQENYTNDRYQPPTNTWNTGLGSLQDHNPKIKDPGSQDIQTTTISSSELDARDGPSQLASSIQGEGSETELFGVTGSTDVGQSKAGIKSPIHRYSQERRRVDEGSVADSVASNGGTTGTGFNSIGHQTKRNQAWHNSSTRSGQPGAISKNLSTKNNSSVPNNGGSARPYQSRGSQSITKRGGGNQTQRGSINGANVYRKGKSKVVTPLEETVSSLQKEPSGWGDLPSNQPVVDMGTSAWGAPLNDSLAQRKMHQVATPGWGETIGNWNVSATSESDANGTRAAGWHGNNGKNWKPDAASTAILEKHVEKLSEMGFQREDALKALTANQNNFDNALGDLLALMAINENGTQESPQCSNSTTLIMSPSTSLTNMTVPVTASLRRTPAAGTRQSTPVTMATQQTSHLPSTTTSVSGAAKNQIPNQLANNKRLMQFFHQQQLSQQAVLMQLASMPPHIANLTLQIANLQVIQQQLLQQQLQLRALTSSPQVIAQQQQNAQQLMQVAKILQTLQPQLLVALKSHQNPLKGATQQGTSFNNKTLPANLPQNLFNQPKAHPITTTTQHSTIPSRPSATGAAAFTTKESRMSTGSIKGPNIKYNQVQPTRSISTPTTTGDTKRTLPKIKASYNPDSIPEFKPGKPWQPRPKPTEPAQLYGNAGPSSPMSELSPGNPTVSTHLSPGNPTVSTHLSPGNPTVSTHLSPGNPTVSTHLSPGNPTVSTHLSPSKLSAEARPFALSSAKPYSSMDSTLSITTSPICSPELTATSPSGSDGIVMAKESVQRPPQLTLPDDLSMPLNVSTTYGLSTTPLSSVWAVSDLFEMSGFTGAASMTAGESGSDTGEDGKPVVTGLQPATPFEQGLENKDNPPSTWLLVKGLCSGDQEELKAKFSEVGEPKNFFISDSQLVVLVRYHNKEQTQLAKSTMNAISLSSGSFISVEYASDEDIGNFFTELNSPVVLSPSTLATFNITNPAEGENFTEGTSLSDNGSEQAVQPAKGIPHDRKPSKWNGPPIQIPRSEVGQLWSKGSSSIVNFTAPTPTTPDGEDWSHISSSPSLSKFLPDGLF